MAVIAQPAAALLGAMLSVGVLCGQGTPASGETATVRGKVTDASTDAAVTRGWVKALLRNGPPQPMAVTPIQADGTFVFYRLDPGEYFLFAQAPGYGEPTGGDSSSEDRREAVSARAGKVAEGGNLRLLRRARVSGIVLDAEGQPAAGASVDLVPVSADPRQYTSGVRLAALSGRCNSEGEFELTDLPSGRYWVRVIYQPLDGMNSWNHGSPEGPRPIKANYGTQYHPGGRRRSEASILTVPPGGTIDGLRVSLRLEETFTIRGYIAGLQPETLKRRVNLSALPVGDPLAGVYTLSGPDGTFELSDLIADDYLIVGRTNPGDTARYLYEQIRVSTNLDGLRWTFHPGTEVRGKAHFQTQDLAAAYFTTQIELNPESLVLLDARDLRWSFRDSGEPVPSPASSFTLDGVPPGTYWLSVGGLDAANLYLHKAMANGEDCRFAPIRIAGGGGSMSLVLEFSEGAATLSGRLELPLSWGYLATVSVIPQGGSNKSPLARTIRTNRDGTFELKGLAPGQYRVQAHGIAGQDLRQLGAGLRESIAEGVVVELAPGENKTIALRWDE